MTEAFQSLTPQIAGLESPQDQHSCIRVHFKLPSAECQRYLDEAILRENARVSYDPKDDAYIIPVAFPMEILLAFNATVLEPQNPAK